MKFSLVLRRFAPAVAIVSALGLFAGLAPSVSAAPQKKPTVGECFNAEGKALEGMSLDSAPVNCDRPHTLETFHVAQWSTGNPYDLDIDRLRQRAEELCKPGTKVNSFLGIPARGGPDSRAYWYFFFPSKKQWNQGERWIRCDIALQRGWKGVQRLSGRMSDLIARQGVRAWAWCTKSEPTTVKLQAPIPCGVSRSPWVSAASTRLKGAKYPGFGNAEKQASEWCSRVASRESRVSRPAWVVWWSTEEDWTRNGAGYAWCYMNLAETRWS